MLEGVRMKASSIGPLSSLSPGVGINLAGANVIVHPSSKSQYLLNSPFKWSLDVVMRCEKKHDRRVMSRCKLIKILIGSLCEFFIIFGFFLLIPASQVFTRVAHDQSFPHLAVRHNEFNMKL